jgi:hypothetical protein
MNPAFRTLTQVAKSGKQGVPPDIIPEATERGALANGIISAGPPSPHL